MRIVLLLMCFCSITDLRAQLLVPIISGSPSAFDPSQLSNLSAWYAADTGLTCTSGCSNGNTVTAWADKSSNANNLTGSCLSLTGGTYVASAINSMPGVGLNSSCFSFGTPLGFGSGETIFVVTANTYTIYKGNFVAGDEGSLTYWSCNSGKQQGSDKAWQVQLGTGTAACDTSWHQMNMTYNGTTVAFRLDKATDGSATPSQSIGLSQLYVGVDSHGLGQDFRGTIAEAIIYSRVLSGGEITQVETYLNGRYGL